MNTQRAIGRFGLVTVGLVACLALAGCGGVHIRAEDHVPAPLLDELPLKAGVYYSPEFRAFTHTEERWGTQWQVALGGAHVTKIDRLLRAMFPQLVDVPDLARPPQPPLDLILEPRFEEYSFVTPRDAGTEYYAVTIRYRVNLYDGQARLLDSLVYTGYGSTPAGGMSTEKPLLAATEHAMRDAGAKFATEFAEQATVQKLVRGETPEPMLAGGTAGGGAIGEVALPTGPPEPAPSSPAPAPAPAAPTSAEATPAAPTSAAPAAAEPAPSEPAPVEPTPAASTSTEPPPTEPTPGEPAPGAAPPT